MNKNKIPDLKEARRLLKKNERELKRQKIGMALGILSWFSFGAGFILGMMGRLYYIYFFEIGVIMSIVSFVIGGGIKITINSLFDIWADDAFECESDYEESLMEFICKIILKILIFIIIVIGLFFFSVLVLWYGFTKTRDENEFLKEKVVYYEKIERKIAKRRAKNNGDKESIPKSEM